MLEVEGNVFEVERRDADHSPFVSRPARTAEVIRKAAQETMKRNRHNQDAFTAKSFNNNAQLEPPKDFDIGFGVLDLLHMYKISSQSYQTSFHL